MRAVSKAQHLALPLINRCRSFASIDRFHKHRYSTRTMASGHSEGRKSNRLAQEQSAYLLQHAENPVDWYPWGEEAFAVARQRDCPIFLSIGYSSCHWCHVMEHESFESEEIAEVLNKSFVAIKVDKEQRPDVDKTYMTYIQATQGGGGWPMSVFLTPELHPFFGGTYFPPQDAYGRPGFKTVLNRLALIWNQKKEEIKASSADSMRQLGEIISSRASGSGDAGDTVEELAKSISYCANSFEHRFDSRLGGFGSAPKFPRPSELLVLMTEYARLLSINKEDDARRMLHMATFTMKQMASGGMRDQLGGGFHRYSVDEYWHVPHFEIMLYDNPQLVQSNLAAFQITRDLSHASTARGVLDYLLRDMKHPEGGFCAAEDADSLDTSDGKKKEGQFYVWSEAEILEVLGSGGGGGGGKLSSSELASMFASHYGIKPEGNCTRSPRSDPHHEFQGKNVLYQAKTLEETSRAGNLSIGEADELLSFCREKLFNARKTRPRPFRDDKILTAWNGMAICALATAGRVLSSEDPPLEKLFPVEGRNPLEYIQAAKTAAECIRKFLHDRTTGHLRRAYMNGPSNVPGFSDDYAWCIAGNLELYFATGEVEYVQWAMELQEKMDELFWDAAGGGYYQSPSPASITTESGEETTGRGESTSAGVLLRMKEDYDGAEPAASSIAVSNLWKLAALSGTQKAAELKRQAGKCAAGFSGQLKEAPSALPQMCAALHLLELGHARQVIIAGKKGEADTEALINAAYSVHAPDMVVIHLDLSNEPAMNFWKEQNPEAVSIAEATGMTVNEPATAFICQNFTCKKPTTDPEVVKKTLAEVRTGTTTLRRGGVELPFKQRKG